MIRAFLFFVWVKVKYTVDIMFIQCTVVISPNTVILSLRLMWQEVALAFLKRNATNAALAFNYPLNGIKRKFGSRYLHLVANVLNEFNLVKERTFQILKPS